jgi:hypothetical protein
MVVPRRVVSFDSVLATQMTASAHCITAFRLHQLPRPSRETSTHGQTQIRHADVHLSAWRIWWNLERLRRLMMMDYRGKCSVVYTV